MTYEIEMQDQKELSKYFINITASCNGTPILHPPESVHREHINEGNLPAVVDFPCKIG